MQCGAHAVDAALAGAASVTVVNRSKPSAEELVALINGKTKARAEYAAWDRPYRVPQGTDIVVNATSIGLFPDIEVRLNLDAESLRRCAA